MSWEELYCALPRAYQDAIEARIQYEKGRRMGWLAYARGWLAEAEKLEARALSLS